MNSIPIIDFSCVSDSNKEITEKVQSALANVGFLYIVNHGIDVSKVKKNHFFLLSPIKDSKTFA